MTESRFASIVLDANVTIQRRDGALLMADIYRAPRLGQVPALLLRLPYNKSRAQSYWYAAPAWYAERGYAVVVEDVRGRFCSPGNFRPFEHEANDGADLIRWVADQPWCDGNVGMYGYSYSGLAQMLTAGSHEDIPLRAIAPAMSPPALGEGCLYQAGVPAAAFLLSWATELGALDLDISDRSTLRQLVQRPLSDYQSAVCHVNRDWVARWLALDPNDAYWHEGFDHPAYDQIRALTLHIGGWYDTFRIGAIDHFQKSRRKKEGSSSTDSLVVGPWTHHPVLAASTRPILPPDPLSWNIDNLQLQFFDAALRGEGDFLAQDSVRVAILNSADTWTGDQWPPASTSLVCWYLGSDGRANGLAGDGRLSLDGPLRSPPDYLIYDHSNPVPSLGGDDCGDPDIVGMGPMDQEAVERRGDVLVYTSPALAKETVIMGETEVVLYVDSVDPESQWLSRLCLVTAGGLSINIAETVVRCFASENYPTRVVLTVGDVAFRIGKGERLRLHITHGSSPRWGGLRDENGQLRVSRSVVLHDPDYPSSLHVRELS